MKNKVAYRMMLERLNSRAWEENDERVVAEVQKIAKLTENKEKTRRKRVGRKIAIWQGGRILVTGTAQELSEVISMDKKQFGAELDVETLILKVVNLNIWRRNNERTNHKSRTVGKR